MLKVLVTSIFVGFLFVYFANAQEVKFTRQKALKNLKSCSVSLRDSRCKTNSVEDDAGFLIKLYERGDKALLTHLLYAGLRSDGALSAVLGDFYSNVLEKDPKSFLLAISDRTKKEQIYLTRLTVGGDGSGSPNNWINEMRAKLIQISKKKNNKLSKVAKVCADELKKLTT